MPHSNFLGRMPWHLRLPNVQAQQPDLNHPCTSNECRFLYPGEKQTQPRRGKGKGISKRSSLQTTQRKPSSRCQSFEYSQCLALKRSTSWSPCRSPPTLESPPHLQQDIEPSPPPLESAVLISTMWPFAIPSRTTIFKPSEELSEEPADSPVSWDLTLVVDKSLVTRESANFTPVPFRPFAFFGIAFGCLLTVADLAVDLELDSWGATAGLCVCACARARDY